MKISIITVCYNSAQTISLTLESVREQTHDAIEHIVIDGGSSDETLAVVAREGKHVAKLVSEPDRGIYDAMNKGIEIATGDVIAFLNADDYYHDVTVLERVAKVMQEERLDALYGDVEFFRSTRPDGVARRYNSGRFSAGALSWGWMPAHPALFVRRTLFKRFGGFRVDYRIAGDFEFVARVFQHGQLRHRHLSAVLVRMKLGGASTGGWRATVELNRAMMRACRANAVPTNWFKLMLRYPFKGWEFLHVLARRDGRERT